ARHAPPHPLGARARMPDGSDPATLDFETDDAEALVEVGGVLRLELVTRHAPPDPLRARARLPHGGNPAGANPAPRHAPARVEVRPVLRLERAARHAPPHPLGAHSRTPDRAEGDVAHRTSFKLGMGRHPSAGHTTTSSSTCRSISPAAAFS